MEVLKVNSSVKSYNIFIGENIFEEVNKNIPPKSKKIIITDENIYHLGLTEKIKLDNLCEIIVVPAGEKSKSFDCVTTILQKITKHNITRNDVLIAFGGGVVGDLTGFIASIYLRGIEFVQVPTTLLSMVDSSVGGKTAINFNNHKNNVGSFYNPKFVVIDTNFLNTLNIRQRNSGLVEVIKMGLIKNAKIIELLEKHNFDEITQELITLSVKGKIEVVEEDEKEQGLRKILNFGHTIGHGIESYYNFEKILHGEAVGIGMIKMMDNSKIKETLLKIMKKYNLPLDIEYDKNEVFELITHDKKSVSDDEIDIILLKSIGECYIKRVSFFTLKNYL